MADTSKPVSDPIRLRDKAYYRRRQQNRVFGRLAKFFAEEAAAGRITKKEIAERLGKERSQITRWLANPSNFELDTISDILLAMGAEMDHDIVRFSDRNRPNYSHRLIRELSATATKVGQHAKINIIKCSNDDGSSKFQKETAAATVESSVKVEARLENVTV